MGKFVKTSCEVGYKELLKWDWSDQGQEFHPHQLTRGVFIRSCVLQKTLPRLDTFLLHKEVRMLNSKSTLLGTRGIRKLKTLADERIKSYNEIYFLKIQKHKE